MSNKISSYTQKRVVKRVESLLLLFFEYKKSRYTTKYTTK